MPYGYNGKILHVDLTYGKLQVEEPPEEFYRKYMGGGAMGMYYILREMPRGTDALAPEAVLTVMASVTTGTPISGQSRVNVNARSPVSDGIGDSQSGGFFPAEMKFSGYDGIVITGRSPKPVYLSLLHGNATLHDASHLVGKMTGEVDALLRSEVGEPKAEVLQYGPAADNGVLFSSLISMASRSNGRTGMGLVMASKNLRAIVARGKGPLKVADPKALAALSKSGAQGLGDNPDVDGLRQHGTASVVMPQHLMGTLPTFNYNAGQFALAEDISGERMTETILKERDTCYACAVHCKRVVEITEGSIWWIRSMAVRSMRPSARSARTAGSMTWQPYRRPTRSAICTASTLSPVGRPSRLPWSATRRASSVPRRPAGWSCALAT